MNIEPTLHSGNAPRRAHVGPSDSAGEHGVFEVDFRRLAAMARRNIYLIAAIVFATVVAGLIITLLITPVYEAEASIQIDQQADRVLESEEVQPTAGIQDTERFLQTQTDILESRALALRVAQTLNLIGNPTFFDRMNADLPDEGTGGARDQALRDATMTLLSENLEIELPAASRIVVIGFRSPDPDLAARVANAYAEEFIKSNLQRKFDSSAYARTFLSEQLGEAKARLEESERALNAYAREAGLIRTSDGGEEGSSDPSGSVTTASLLQLNQAANEATAARIAAEQKWSLVASTPLMNIPDVLANQAVQSLLTQRSQAMAALEQERAKHLEAHPTVQQIQAQVTEINRQVDTLASGIRQSIRQQYDSARLREQSLIDQVNGYKSATLAEQDLGVRYNILAREADTNRTLYDGLLQRFKEVSAAAGVTSNNVSVVDRAEPPALPASPKLSINLALALFVGILLAIIFVLIREQLDDRIRSGDDIEAKLDVPLLGLIPISSDPDVRGQLQDPRSPVAEAYNALRTSLLYSTSSGLPHVMFVTSTQAAEGKSTTSFAIASGMARMGKSVVLLDVDLRRPALHLVLGVTNKLGLSDLLTSTMPVRSTILETDIPNLSFIPSGPIPPSPTELLSNSRMLEVLSELRQQFDLVLLDGPPVLGLADAPILAAIADAAIFVIEANRGHRGGTKAAVRRLRASQGNVLGAVLTKFDAAKSGTGYGYYGYEYYSYGEKHGS